MAITFREVGLDDLAKVAAWRNDNLLFYKDQRPVTAESTLRWYRSLGPESRYYIAAFEGQEIGLARLHDIDTTRRMVGIGGDVVKELRGRGLGRRLFTALIEHCRREGLDHIWLEVLDHNAIALQLYRSLGFREVSRNGTTIRMELAA